MSKYNITITEQKVEIENNKDNKEYQIRTEGGKEQPVDFEKREDGQESKEEIKLEYREKTKDGKWSEWKPFKSKAKWDGGWVTNGMKLSSKELTTGVTMKEEFKPGMGFFNTPTYTCWVGIVIILIGLVALVWWWIASSNKEDKEEESL